MRYLLAAAAVAAAPPALAADPVAGEAAFKRCKPCHAIIAPDETVIQMGGKFGPNLWGVIGRQIGTLEGFGFSAGAVAAGSDGTLWDEAMVAAFVVDPSNWIRQKTADAALGSKMSFKLKEGGADIAAYLASLKAAE